MPTAEEIRREFYEVAERIAPTWEARRELIEEVAAPVREWMIEALAPQPGETVLELAAGVGDTGFEAAAIVGDEGRLISTDFSPGMVDAARRRGAELGLENVDYREMDAERIELESDSVDGVLCRFGYMLMADPAAALAETRRVLRPGGRLALAVWGPPERNPFFALAGMSLAERGHVPPPDPEAAGVFRMASEERTTALLAGAGFESVHTEQVPVQFALADVDDYLAFVADTAGPIGLAVRGLPEDERGRISAELEEALAPFSLGGEYHLPGLCRVAAAG